MNDGQWPCPFFLLFFFCSFPSLCDIDGRIRHRLRRLLRWKRSFGLFWATYLYASFFTSFQAWVDKRSSFARFPFNFEHALYTLKLYFSNNFKGRGRGWQALGSWCECRYESDERNARATFDMLVCILSQQCPFSGSESIIVILIEECVYL